MRRGWVWCRMIPRWNYGQYLARLCARACVLLESRESESERANSLGLSGKFVSSKCVSRVEKKHKLNPLSSIGARSIGPLVGGGMASGQFFYRAWGTTKVTGCCAVNPYFIFVLSPLTTTPFSTLTTSSSSFYLYPHILFSLHLPPFSHNTPLTHIHRHVFLRPVPVPQGPHGEASHRDRH